MPASGPGGTIYNTAADSGLPSLLAKITGMVDTAASNQQALRGAVAIGAAPQWADPGPSILGSITGTNTDGTPVSPGGASGGSGILAAIMGANGMTMPSAPAMDMSASAGPTPSSGAGAGPSASPSGFMPRFQDAIAGIESKGNYGAIGPTTASGDQAVGKYQVMASNIPQWTKDALGASLTPAQFLASPQAQDAVFNAKFGQFLQQTGKPADAASMWFTGKPQAQGGSAADQLGTTGSSYVAQFMNNLRGGGVSTPGSTPPSPAMAYAPQGGSASATPAGSAIASATGGGGRAPMPQATADSADPNGPGQIAAAADTTPPAASLDQIKALIADPSTRAQGVQAWKQFAAAQSGGGTAQPAASASPAAPQSGSPLYSSLAPPPTMDQIQAGVVNPASRAIALEMWKNAVTPKPPITMHEGDILVGPRGPIYAAPVKLEDKASLVPGLGGAPIATGPASYDLKQIGTNDAGQPTYGSFNTRTGVTTPVGQAPGTVGMGAPSDPTLSGDGYLATLPAGFAGQVKAIAEGKMKLPTGSGANSQIASALRSAVLRYDPTFDAANTDARFKTRLDFTSGGPNSAASSITAGNTALAHLGELSDAAEALNNGQIPLVNEGRQALAGALGGNIPGVQFNNTVGKYVEEATRLYRGTGGSDSDIKRDLAGLSPSMSPPQLHAAIQQQVQLISGKLSALQQRWAGGMGKAPMPVPLLDDKAQATIARVAARAGLQPAGPSVPIAAAPGGQASAAAAGQMPTLSDPSQVRQLPSGTRFRTPDGRIGTAP